MFFIPSTTGRLTCVYIMMEERASLGEDLYLSPVQEVKDAEVTINHASYHHNNRLIDACTWSPCFIYSRRQCILLFGGIYLSQETYIHSTRQPREMMSDNSTSNTANRCSLVANHTKYVSPNTTPHSSRVEASYVTRMAITSTWTIKETTCFSPVSTHQKRHLIQGAHLKTHSPVCNQHRKESRTLIALRRCKFDDSLHRLETHWWLMGELRSPHWPFLRQTKTALERGHLTW